MLGRIRDAYRKVLVTVYGPDAISEASADRQLAYMQQELSGRGVRPYWGLSGSAETTFNGPVLNPQSFVGPTQMGAQGLSIPEGERVSLPSSKRPDAGSGDGAPNPFADYTSYEGALGWG